MKTITLILSALLLIGASYYLGTRTTTEEAPVTGDLTEQQPGVDTTTTSSDDADDVATSQTDTRKSLSLANTGLTKVPLSVFERTDLETLDLSQNKLTGALQAEVRHLSHLKVLDLSDNAFTGVPAEVGQLTNLEVLDLSNNKLTGLPHELGNLKNLKTLTLSGNDYSEADLTIIKATLSANVNIVTK